MAGMGRYTRCDLREVTALCQPWEEKGGLARPVFSKGAAQLSFELAASAYDLQLDEWQEAGWRDFSYQIDNTLLTGPSVNRRGGVLADVVSDYLHHLAQARLKRLNPISQIKGALRQREKADTCKAFVMAHPLLGGRYLIAIGFMGTGRRIYDWFSNFRLNQEEGMHAGFLQLTREFEKNGDAIAFPETARELGLDRLTLNDILLECRQPDSRFRLWMAGHSQGGAVMQLFAYREMRRGFLRQHMLGYGFASPSVAYAPPGGDLAGIPLFHLISAEDVFPRMGARLHVGVCRVLYPDAAMRAACFRAAWAEDAYRAAASLMRQVYDSSQAFLLVSAMLRALRDVPREDAMTVLNGLIGSLLPERLVDALGSRREEIVSALIRRADQGYALSSGGQTPPEVSLSLLRARVARMIRTYGAQAFSRAATLSLSLPHKLRESPGNNGTASYLYLVTDGFDALRSRVWCPPVNRMNPPVRRGKRALPGGRFARWTAQKNRRNSRNNAERKEALWESKL